jgi:endonuclease/exonuclease/phosphatase (EEP) superfamily protein YafD
MKKKDTQTIGKPKKNRRKYIFLTVLSAIFLILALIGLVSGYVNPYNSTLCEYIQLALPIVLVVNFILLICWLFHPRWRMLMPLAALVSNFGFLGGVTRIPVKSSVEPNLRVMTYNVHGFNDGESLYAVADFLNNQNVDVACLQEFEVDKSVDPEEVFSQYPFCVFHSEFAILSKYPIVDSSPERFVHNGNGALAAVINVNGKRVSVVTSHLQTTGISLSKKKYDREGRLSLDRAEDNFANNAKVRAAQSEELRQIIGNCAKPVIFCGDLNDVPSSFAYHKVKGLMKDGFKEAGSGYCYTYRHLFRLFRIDYIFYSSSIRAASYESPDMDFSDHKPVIMSLAI